MSFLVSLIAIGVFVGVWVLINNKFKKNNRPILMRHLVGFTGGGGASILILAIAQSVGVIETPNKKELSAASTTENTLAVLSNAEIQKKPSFREMMNSRNDYTEEAGTLMIASESPLSVILYAEDMANQSEENKIADMKRAALYGVYKTFLYTDEPQISLSVRHLDIKRFNPREVVENPSLIVSLSVTREKALEVVKTLIPSVKAFEDLIETKTIGGVQLEGEWIDEFGELYWKREGQAKLLNALQESSN